MTLSLTAFHGYGSIEETSDHRWPAFLRQRDAIEKAVLEEEFGDASSKPRRPTIAVGHRWVLTTEAQEIQ